MGVKELLEELEEPPPGCDLMDVDRLLRQCGYECYSYPMTLLYANEAWNSFLTFPASKRTIPHRRLHEVIATVRWHLRREGKL